MLKAFHSLLSEDDKPDDKPDAVNRDKLAFLAQLDVHVTPYLAPLKDDRCPGKEGLLVSNSLHWCDVQMRPTVALSSHAVQASLIK